MHVMYGYLVNDKMKAGRRAQDLRKRFLEADEDKRGDLIGMIG